LARVLLSKEIQYQLCFSAREKLEVNWAGLARYFQISSSTLANWYKCKRLLPQEIFLNLARLTGISIQNPKLLKDNWGQVKGGKLVWLRYGRRPVNKNPGHNKSGASLAKKFSLPGFSKDLAEFMGIMLGDGGIDKGQISITLGCSTDYQYAQYIIKLLQKLFAARIGIYYPKKQDTIRIRISGINLVKNLFILGLIKGNKIRQQIDIPVWIKQNDDYAKSCIRGLIDTDGCVHRKVRKTRNSFEYRSIGITFCSASRPLQKSFMKLLDNLGFKTAISGYTIYLCGEEQMRRYVDEIGFSNPKHLSRYKVFLRDYGWKKLPQKNCTQMLSTV